jgi:hypothetical protein
MSYPVGPMPRTPAAAQVIADMLAEDIREITAILDGDTTVDGLPLGPAERASMTRLLDGLCSSHDVYWALAHDLDWI